MNSEPVSATNRRVVVGVTCVVTGTAIAAVAPWGITMGAALAHAPLLRICLFVAMGASGLFFARRAELEIPATGFRHPLCTALFIGLLLAVYLLAIDGVLFRSALPPAYQALFVTQSLSTRLLYFILRSFNEGIVYQLFFGSTLAWLFGLVWRRADGIAPGAYWLALIAAHLINLCINLFAVAGASFTPATLTYDALRFVAPGILWAYLYRRHGLTTVLVAHCTTHVFFQPLIGVALA